MLPKIAGALDAAKSGVNAVHIIDGRVPHAMLLEILTDQAYGTMIRSHRDLSRAKVALRYLHRPMSFPRHQAAVLRQRASQYPVVTVTGPRQAGKTTLCREGFPDLPYVNLERPDLREFAQADARGFLQRHRDGAVLDEIQHVPALLSWIQAEVDERPRPGALSSPAATASI